MEGRGSAILSRRKDDYKQRALSGQLPYLGPRIFYARRFARMTQTELAEKAGVVQNSICNYETGNYQPRLHTLVLIALALGVSTDWLLGLADSDRSKGI